MSGRPILALITTPTLDPGVEVLVRLCVGLVAAGCEVALLEAGPGHGVLSGERAKPDEVERQLEGLAAFGVDPVPVTAADLGAHLGRATDVLRAADPARTGTPEVLVVDDAYLAGVNAPDLVRALCDAGQVLRASDLPA